MACVAGMISFCGGARANSLLSAAPNGGNGFSISAGYYYTWAAVGFTPKQDYSFTSITLWLTGYDGSHNSQPAVSLWSDNNFSGGGPQPGIKLADFSTPAPNDGALSAFDFSLSESYNLQAGATYWLVVSENGPYEYPYSGTFNWVGGDSPSGEAVYHGSEILYNGSGFQPWSATPAFSIGSADNISQVTAVPEPSAWMFAALLAGMLMLTRTWQNKSCLQVAKKVRGRFIQTSR